MTVHAPETPDQVEQADAVEPSRRTSRRPSVAGALAGAWALLVGIALVTCVVMLVWAVSPNSAGDSAAAWRAAGMTWLGAHLVPLTIAGQSVTLLPIGGLLLGLLLSRRGGGWVGRMLPDPTGPEVAAALAGGFLAYGAGGAAIAWLAAGESASAHPAWAFGVSGVVCAAGILWGLSRRTGLLPAARARVPESIWRTLVAGLAAVVGLFAVGAGLVSMSLVRHYGDVAGTLSDLDAGIIGSAGLTLLGVLSLPNLAVWAMSVAVGPGFELGRTGQLSALDGQVESLPALPVLAAIPASAPGWAPALLLLPVALGVLAGRIRWGRDLPTFAGALLASGGLAVVVAALVAALAWLSGGSLGGGRLATVGPVLLPVTAAATGLLVLGFLAEAGFVSLRLSWELHRAERRLAAMQPDSEQPKAGPQAGAEPDPGVIDLTEPTAAQGAGGAPGVVGRVGAVGAAAVTVVTGAGGSVVAQMGAVGSAALAGVGSLLPKHAEPEERRDQPAEGAEAEQGPVATATGADDDTDEIPICAEGGS